MKKNAFTSNAQNLRLRKDTAPKTKSQSAYMYEMHFSTSAEFDMSHYIMDHRQRGLKT
jgi:hypothetical protein